MRALDLGGKSLTDVVEQTRSLGNDAVNAKLVCDNTGNVSDLKGVSEDVLTVAGTVLKSTQKLYKLGIDSVDTDLEGRALTRRLDLSLDLTASLVNGVLDTGGMDTSVGDELFKGKTCDLTANGVEAGNGDRLGGIVNDKINARKLLDGTDVSALASDYSTLHIVAGKSDGRGSGLGNVVGRTSLNSKRDDVLCFSVRLLAKTGLDLNDLESRIVLNVLLDTLKKLSLCLVDGAARNSLKLR